MDLGIFDRFCPSLKTRAQLRERGYVIPMHRNFFGLTSGWRILEIIFCRLVTVIPVHNTGKVGGHLKERED